MTRVSGKSVFMIAVTGLLVAAFVVLGKCAYDRRLRKIDVEAMRLGAEDVARRLSETQDSRASIEALYNRSAISAAKSLARIVDADPSVLDDRDEFAALVGELGVDEIHVANGDGVIVASAPVNYVGYVMASSPQSAEFLPAITNRAFELVQKAMEKGYDGRLFQYAGVARLDRPGIVQVGFRPDRLESAVSAADYRRISKTTRIGRGGYVSVSPERDGDCDDGAESQLLITENDDGRRISLHAECGGYHVVVTLPYRGWRLADDRPYELLVAVLVALLVLLLFGGMQLFGWHGFQILLAELKVFFTSSRGPARRRRGFPVFVVSSAVFLLAIVLVWVISDRAYRGYARALLESGTAEFAKDYSLAVDNSLFFVGDAILASHPTPESFADVDLDEILRYYCIDELNVVGRDGRIVASTMSGDVIGQNQWAKKSDDGSPCPWDFCVELIQKGVKRYAQTFRESATEKGIYRMYVGVAFPKVPGYIQIGFDQRRIAAEFDYGLYKLARTWTIGERGYFLLARNSGEIISCGHPRFDEAHRRGEISTLVSANFDVRLIPEVEESLPTPPFEAVLYGEPCLCVSRRLGEYHRMIAVMPLSEIVRGRHRAVLFVSTLLLVVLGLGSVFGARLLDLVARLREFIIEDKRRRDEELRNARAIQTESLPRIFPDDPVFRIYARMDTAKEVGGDFYDFYTLPSGKQLFLIADTSGKGIPAAMFMMKAKAVIRAGLFETSDLVTAVSEANDRLSEHNDANMFVTAWIGVFDPATREVEFVDCGHNPPLVKRADRSVSWVRTRPCLALAAMSGVRFRSERFRLEPRESLFLYTDGVTEAMNLSGEQYGEKRLEADLAAVTGPRFVDLIREKVEAFAAGAEQSDDITMLVLHCKPT